MHVAPAEFGFSVADGERVEVSFSEGDLVLRFVDDATYEVLESSWLLDEVRLEGYSVPEYFVHHVLCFNAERVLEVISRRATR